MSQFIEQSSELFTLAQIKATYGYTGKFQFQKAFAEDGTHKGWKAFLKFKEPKKVGNKKYPYLIIYTREQPSADSKFYQRKPHQWCSANNFDFEI